MKIEFQLSGEGSIELDWDEIKDGIEGTLTKEKVKMYINDEIRLYTHEQSLVCVDRWVFDSSEDQEKFNGIPER